MARDLDVLKEALWEQFEKARKHSNYYDDYGTSSGNHPASQARMALAEVAKAIVAVESEQRARAEMESRRPSPLQGKTPA